MIFSDMHSQYTGECRWGGAAFTLAFHPAQKIFASTSKVYFHCTLFVVRGQLTHSIAARQLK
jgi:hypothetical protein